jgi:ATP-dependent DNA helicase PIF1
MLTKNKDLEMGLCNGTRGVVTSFNDAGIPVVFFDTGDEIPLGPEQFEVDGGSHTLVRKQIPLILAWAITIHKAQGSTLSNVITDLSDVFGYSMTYVTLSRVKSLEGLFLIGIDFNRITCNPEVKQYYEELAKQKETAKPEKIERKTSREAPKSNSTMFVLPDTCLM